MKTFSKTFSLTVISSCIAMILSSGAGAAEEEGAQMKLIAECKKDGIQENICTESVRDPKLQIFIGGQYYNGSKTTKPDYTRALAWFRMAGNIPVAEYNIGLIYERGGYGVMADTQMAIVHYGNAAAGMHPGAMYKLGRIYSTGNRVEQDLPKAGEYFRESHDLGYPYGSYGLALWYMNTMPDDHWDRPDMCNKVKDLIMKAEDGKVPEAFTLEGILYEKGILCTEQSDDKAVELYNKASYEGDYQAQSRSSELLIRNGRIDEAFRMLTAAVNDERNPYAMCVLGELFSSKKSGSRYDPDKARDMYQKAADINAPCGLFHIGLEYFQEPDADYDKALEYFTKAQENGSSDAEYYLGLMYSRGIGVQENTSKAIRFFKNANLAGNLEAQNALGEMFIYGNGVKQNYKTAFNYIKGSADAGRPEAMINMGRIYAYGLGQPLDTEKAREWYLKAQASGIDALPYLGELEIREGKYEAALEKLTESEKNPNSEAEFWLGYMYEHGLGVTKDLKEALNYYENSVAHGSTRALVALGRMYQEGVTGKPEPEMAFDLYQKAADRKEPDAIYHLGLAYETGNGVKADNQKALRYFSEAAKSGHPEAMYYVGRYMEEGVFTTSNIQEAVKYYKTAASRGVAEAEMALGRCYEEGTGVSRSLPKSYENYLAAATHGNRDAMRITGDNLMKGNGTEKDPSSAYVWYEKAANLGDPYAATVTAKVYAQGYDNPRNPEKSIQPDANKARKYLDIGIKQNFPDAKAFKGLCHLHGWLMEKDPKKSFNLFMEAAEGNPPYPGNTEALYYLGYMYEHGIGVTQNFISAVTWYEQAVQQHNHEAELALGQLYLNATPSTGITQDKSLGMRLIRDAANGGNEKAAQILEELE
ncbi:MAG: SEL1-like repeat protein [Succinimonas sp.]|nr:SEL1-like repeat protein [Succinimonas sp.]